LPAACDKDVALCESVRRYLNRYMQRMGLSRATVEAASADESANVIPNQHGLPASSDWAASVGAYYQPTDHVLVSLGAVAHDDEVVATGSLLSLGWDRAQLDLGYRDHWFSPMTDSAMLISTEAQTMPSITLSNYVPLTRFGLHYQLFVARMSQSQNIASDDVLFEGRPRIVGVHVATEPALGWSLGLNRLLQFGGGPRASSFSDVLRAFVSPSRFDNQADFETDGEFGNQVASITTRFLFPNDPQFAVYFEYAGEDTSYGKNALLGNSSLSAGIDFPLLFRRFDFTYEATDWQNGWYVHHIYRDGLVNERQVIGHWSGDQSAGVGGTSHMARLGWRAPFNDATLELRYRTIEFASYAGLPFERGHDVTLRYSQPVGPFIVGGELFSGSDAFGEDFNRVAVFVRLGERNRASFNGPVESGSREDDDANVFITAGAQASRVRIDLDNQIPKETTAFEIVPRIGLGARRRVSDRSDLGARVEFADVDGTGLLAVRALDYRYRMRNERLGLTGFLGAARYDLGTVAYGIYAGGGAQWRNVLPGWDVDLDFSVAFKVARDDLLPSDPIGGRPDSFYDIYGATLAVSRRF
jgi:hypothetical protein